MISEFLAELPYGERKIKVRMPDKLSPFLVEPRKMEASRDPNFELCMAIDHPYGERGLGDLVESGDRVSIVVSDATRPTPSRLILPPLLDRLS
ncbi:MAG: lactate racemase domain-containing protein, partial [Candidatus Bathyarchaeia archaeon]